MGQCNCRKKHKVHERRCGTGEGWDTPGGVRGRRGDPAQPHPLEHTALGNGGDSERRSPSWSQTPAEEPGGLFRGSATLPRC